MQIDQGGDRINDLRLILSRVAYAASLFDENGISIRFMNTLRQKFERGDGTFEDDNVKSQEHVERLMKKVNFSGLTPMGTQLRAKVIEPLVVGPARNNQLQKPVLIIAITDGQPAGEPQGTVFDAIRYASTELSRNPRYGQGAVSFEFAQVGDDLKATEFLGKLDSDPSIGHMVDCTSSKLAATLLSEEAKLNAFRLRDRAR